MKAAFIACLVLVCLHAPQGTRLSEPPQEFVLRAAGKECALRIGQPAELPKEFAGQKVTLYVTPTRLFDYKGLRFRYPQNYFWEYEQKESGEQYVTLSGHTNQLLLQIYADKMEPAVLVEKLVRAVAGEIGSRAHASVSELVGSEQRKLAGKQVEVTTAGQKSTTAIYAVRLAEECVALVVKDSCTEEGKPDPETEALLKLLAESLEWPK
jgi:hypothetical protein